MLKLLQCDMPELLERLRTIKEFYDEGAHNIVPFFSNIEINTGDFEMLVYEEMWSLPGYLDNHELYYEDENGRITEDSEVYGEVWMFATDEMREYYRLLKELRTTGKISRRIYALKRNEMEKYVQMYVADSQYAYDIGLFCKLVYGRTPKNLCCIKVYVDYNYYYSAFVMCCGIIAIFDKYTEKLKELREQYCSKETILEAA